MAEDNENKDEQSSDPELDNLLDGLISGDDAAESEEASETADEPELDNMLDNLISGDDAAESEEASETADEPELDNLLDDLINEETETQEDSGETLSGSREELELDKMADDPINESSDSVEEEEDKSTELDNESSDDEDDEDLDSLLDDILNDDDDKAETAEIADEEITTTPESEEKIETESVVEEADEDLDSLSDDILNDEDDENEDEDDDIAETAEIADEEITTPPEPEEKIETESVVEEEDEDLDSLSDDILNDDDDKAEADEIADEEITTTPESEEVLEKAEKDEDDENDVEEYEDDDEESSEERIKIGPISVPATRTGKMMLAGGVLGILLTAGGVYFAMKTFAPPELSEVEKNEAEVPEGLTPKKGEDAMTADEEEPADPPKARTEDTKTPLAPGMKEDTQSEVAQELNKSGILSEAAKGMEVVEEDSADLQAALSPESKMVKLATIIPVAFDANDIRVLSFTLEVTFDNEAGAKVFSGALPIFEKITVLTVEQFLKRKFYNDILYVKETLQKRLKLAYNKKIEGDTRVKKIKFKDFLIQ